MTVEVIRRCATVVEAKICLALLEARGFSPVLANGHHAQQDWGSVQALGGVDILLPSSQLVAAKVAIIEAVTNGPDILFERFGDYESPKKFGRLAVWVMISIQVGLFQLLAVYLMVFASKIYPDEWVPTSNISTGAFSYYGGGAPNDIGSNGALLMLLIVGIVIYEFVSNAKN